MTIWTWAIMTLATLLCSNSHTREQLRDLSIEAGAVVAKVLDYKIAGSRFE